MTAASGPLPRERRTSVVMSAVVSLPIIGMGVGTGGACTLDYLRERGPRGYPLVSIEQRSQALQCVANSRDLLARIRSIIPGTVTDFARAFDVSRQAIYDWQAGRPLSDQNAARLRELAHAVDLFEASGIVPTAMLLRRPISADGSFFDWVRLGRAEAAARTLGEIVRLEASQRQILQRHLGLSKLNRADADDIGAPALREKE